MRFKLITLCTHAQFENSIFIVRNVYDNNNIKDKKGRMDGFRTCTHRVSRLIVAILDFANFALRSVQRVL